MVHVKIELTMEPASIQSLFEWVERLFSNGPNGADSSQVMYIRIIISYMSHVGTYLVQIDR